MMTEQAALYDTILSQPRAVRRVLTEERRAVRGSSAPPSRTASPACLVTRVLLGREHGPEGRVLADPWGASLVVTRDDA